MSKLERYIKDKPQDKTRKHTTSVNVEARHLAYLRGDNPTGRKLNLGLLVREFLDSLISEHKTNGEDDL